MFVRERLEIAKGKESLKIHKYVKRLKKKNYNRYRTDEKKKNDSFQNNVIKKAKENV